MQLIKRPVCRGVTIAIIGRVAKDAGFSADFIPACMMALFGMSLRRFMSPNQTGPSAPQAAGDRSTLRWQAYSDESYHRRPRCVGPDSVQGPCCEALTDHSSDAVANPPTSVNPAVTSPSNLSPCRVVLGEGEMFSKLDSRKGKRKRALGNSTNGPKTYADCEENHAAWRLHVRIYCSCAATSGQRASKSSVGRYLNSLRTKRDSMPSQKASSWLASRVSSRV